MTDVITDLSACVDCLMVIANGEYPEDEERRDAIVAGEKREYEAGWIWAYDCPEDCEGWFSMSPCDICRSPLGGDRHPVALIRR